MIICYEEEYDGAMTEEQAIQREQRRIFHDSLIKEGLDLEIEDRSQSFDEKTYFVKIHLPWRTESRYAELMNIKLPVKRFITISVKQESEENQILGRNKFFRRLYLFCKKYWMSFKIITEYDYNLIEKEPSFYSATSGGKREEQFIVKDRMTNYTGAQRSNIVFQILLRAKFDESEKCGIRRLLNDCTYLGCFPLHEGRYDKVHSSGVLLDRRVRGRIYFFPPHHKMAINFILKYILPLSIALDSSCILSGHIHLRHGTSDSHFALYGNISGIKLHYIFVGSASTLNLWWHRQWLELCAFFTESQQCKVPTTHRAKKCATNTALVKQFYVLCAIKPAVIRNYRTRVCMLK